jgi:hypothetical protein
MIDVKDPIPEGPVLGYPWKGVVYTAACLRGNWSAGVVAYWKGYEQKSSKCIVILEGNVIS